MKIGVLATGGHNSKPANYKPHIGTFARRHGTAFSRLAVSAKKSYSRHSRAQGRIAMAASFVSIAIRWRSTTYRSIDRYHRAIDSHLSLCCDRRCVLHIALDRCERHFSCEGATMTHLEGISYDACISASSLVRSHAVGLIVQPCAEVLSMGTRLADLCGPRPYPPLSSRLSGSPRRHRRRRR